MYRGATSIIANSVAYRFIWEKVEIVCAIGFHDSTRPNKYTPMRTNLFLVELSINERNWFLFDIIANSIVLSLSGILTVTDNIYGGLGYVPMHSRLKRSQEENLKAIFYNR